MAWRGIVSSKWLVLRSGVPSWPLDGLGSPARRRAVGDSRVMMGAGGATPRDAWPGWRWVGVALSFAGARRPYVEQGASALKAPGALFLRPR